MCSSGLGQGGRVAWGGIAAGRAARVVGDLRFLQLVVIGWEGYLDVPRGRTSQPMMNVHRTGRRKDPAGLSRKY